MLGLKLIHVSERNPWYLYNIMYLYLLNALNRSPVLLWSEYREKILPSFDLDQCNQPMALRGQRLYFRRTWWFYESWSLHTGEHHIFTIYIYSYFIKMVLVKYHDGEIISTIINARWKTWTPDIFPWRPLLSNFDKHPCFYIFPLEFGGTGYIHKYQKSRILF